MVQAGGTAGAVLAINLVNQVSSGASSYELSVDNAIAIVREMGTATFCACVCLQPSLQIGPFLNGKMSGRLR
ncbi:unnamed protein product [Protopolystoma xenopodis]|uniref:Uncharacterized protein n=1 Tax=Protopolystoma xenopodis TaxID=117903 RepID=A0A3S4ZVE1_9PLAT|nr:unnamed protein product [Protopolystoma xenopodis]